jgi:hypothetical protein
MPSSAGAAAQTVWNGCSTRQPVSPESCVSAPLLPSRVNAEIESAWNEPT